MFSSLTGGKKGSKRLLSGSSGDADKSTGAPAGGSRKAGSDSGGASSSRLTNPFAAAAASSSSSSNKDTRVASDGGTRTVSPLRGSFGRFDPRQLWGGSGSSKDDKPRSGSPGPSSAAAAATGGAGAGAPRRLMSSGSDNPGSRDTSVKQPSAATAVSSATAATALSSATAATPFSSATAAAPLAALGVSSSSFSREASSSGFAPRSGSRQETIATLPSEEIEEVWNALDSEKGTGGLASLNSAQLSPEPGMRWRKGADGSASSSRATTPTGGLPAAAASTGGLPPSSTRGVAGMRRYSSTAGSVAQSDWAPQSPGDAAPAAGPSAAAAAAGPTGDSTGSSPRSSALRDRAKLVREYVKLRSTPTPTPKGSLTGEGSLLTATSETGEGGLQSSPSAAAAAGAGAAAGGLGARVPLLFRSRTPSPNADLPGSGPSQAEGSSGMQPSPLMGRGSLQPSPLMGGDGVQPSPLMGGPLGGLPKQSSPPRASRFSDSSLPPSPVMPESPSQTGRASDGSVADLPSSSTYPGIAGGVRLASLTGGESRLRRKPQSSGGSAQSSPRAPVGIAETEFRRRGSLPEDADEIQAADVSSGGARDSSSIWGASGLRTLNSTAGGRMSSSMSYRDGSAAGALSAGGVAASSSTTNPFARSLTAPASATGGTALGGTGVLGGGSSSSAAGTAGSSAAAAGSKGGAAAAAAGGAAGAAAVSGKPGFLGSLFGIRRKQADVEAPPSPKREPPAAATTAAAALGASPGKGFKSKQQQQQQQVRPDTAPLYDYRDSSRSDNIYTPAAYGDTARYDDRGVYGRSAYGEDYSSSYQPPPRVDPYSSPAYKKPVKDSNVNYKRLFWALLLLLALAGVGVGIWAGVTYGRPRPSAAAGPAFKPTNFTMDLAAGGPGGTGTVENCTSWFSNTTGVEKFRQTVADAYSKALNLPTSAIKVGDVACKPALPKGRLLLSGQALYRISTSISINVPIEGADPGGGLSDGFMDKIARKVAAFFHSGGSSRSSSSSGGGSSNSSMTESQQQRRSPSAAAAAAMANRTSTRLLLQANPGPNTISTGITVEVPGDPAAQAEIIKKIETSSGDILSKPLSDLLGVPVAVEQVQHVGQQQLPSAPSPPPPRPPPPSPPPPSPPPPRPPPPPPPPVRPWRPPVGDLPPTPANIVIIPDASPSPKPRRRRRRSPSPSPTPLPTDLPPGILPGPKLSPKPPSPSPSPDPLTGLGVSPSPSPRPKRSPRPRRSPSPSPAPEAVIPSPSPSPSPEPVPVPPPAPAPSPSPAVVEPAVPPPPEPQAIAPSPSPKPRRRRKRSPSPSPNVNEVQLPYPSPSPPPVVPPPAPLPTPLQPLLPPNNPQMIANTPGAVASSPDAALQLPSPSPQVPVPLPVPSPVVPEVPLVPQIPQEVPSAAGPAVPDGAGMSPAPAFPSFSPNEPYAMAPTCTRAPTSLNSVADGSGRLWGWEKGVSCVFRAAAVATSQPVSYSATTWQSAPTCWGVPTPQTSVLDDLGRLWGWQNGASCAYRRVPPLRGVAPAPLVEWDAAPTCMFAPTQQNSVPDTKGRLWGWQNSQSCAFRG